MRMMNETGEMANDVGTIFSAKDAVRIGLIDEIGGLDTALSRLKKMISSDTGNRQSRRGIYPPAS